MTIDPYSTSLIWVVLMLPVYNLVEDEAGQFAVHIFKVLHVSFPLR